MTHAELVALLNEAADRMTGCGCVSDELCGDCEALATRLRTAADALAGVGSLVDRVSACKGFDCSFHFAEGAGVWVVTDTNFDDEEYRGTTLEEALGALADAYAARAAGEGT